MGFIYTIEDLKKVVKINATIPWESIEPFLNDALDIYIVPQVGQATLDKANQESDKMLVNLVARALGPLALSLATHELGVQFGDSGITVDNQQGKRSPANEAKIENARNNLFFRGNQALDRLLKYLEDNKNKYTDYAEYTKSTKTLACLVKSADEYQNVGLVNIDYSVMTYRELIPAICQLQERDLREWLGNALYEKMLGDQKLTTKEVVLKAMCVRYLCNGSAALYTSRTSHTERQNTGKLEFKALIRPLYRDTDDSGNFFEDQAAFFAHNIHQFIQENHQELGIAPKQTGIDFNRKDKKIFTTVV